MTLAPYPDNLNQKKRLTIKMLQKVRTFVRARKAGNGDILLFRMSLTALLRSIA